MKCVEPSEQFFDLGDAVIGIDWGENGDKAVQMTLSREKKGTLKLIEVKELNKNSFA